MKAVLLAAFLLPIAFARPTGFRVTPKPDALEEYFRLMAPIYALQSPAGDYKGSKSVLGETINIDASFNSDNTLNLVFTGPLSLNCAEEPYVISGDAIDLPNDTKSGDCIHDALQSNSVTLEGITYDSSSDKIDIKAKYSFLSLDIELDHQARRKTQKKLALPELFDAKFSEYALRAPSGVYKADQSIFGLEITSVLSVDTTTFNFEIDQPVTLSCSNEAYTLDGSQIVITNLNSSSDCMEQLSQTWSVTVNSLNYDSTTDSVEADVAFAGLPIKMTFQHSSVFTSRTPKKIAFKTQKELVDALHARARTNVLTDPAGVYHGTKSVLGQNVDTTLTINADGTLNFIVAGVVSINCNEEAFSYANDAITLSNLASPTDCVAEALSSNHVSLKDITYDPTANRVTVDLKYSVVTISIPLDHQSTLASLVASRFALYALNDPSGTYKGTKTVLGQTVAVTASITDSSHFALTITGAISTSCPDEQYSYDSSSNVINLPNLGSSSDCVNKAMSDNGVEFKSLTYTPASDEITLTVSKLITIVVVLTK